MSDKRTLAHIHLEVLANWEHYEDLLDTPGAAFHFNELCKEAIASYALAEEVEKLKEAFRCGK